MRLMRTSVFLAGLALAGLMLAGVRADDEKKGKRPGGDRPGGPFGGAAGPLVPGELAEKLKLTGEQKDKLAKLQKEFDEKVKPAADKLKELREKAGKDRGDREAFQALREQGETIRKTRGEFEDKVKGLLTDDQKKTFEQESRRPAPPGDRPGQPGRGQPGRGQPGRDPQPGRGGPPGGIFSAEVQERLGLSAEQKEKLDKIKKELDAKTQEVLTDEQKKKLEELRGERPRGPGRRPQQ